MTMTVYVSVMVTVMLQTGRSSVPLPGIRVARVQRMHLLQMMVVIVNVVQATVRSRVGIRGGRLAGYAGTDVMMVHARVSG